LVNHVLITGGAGFIGSHLIKNLLKSNAYHITCIDNFDPYYDAKIKRDNISEFLSHPNFNLVEENIVNLASLREQLKDVYHVIVHLAAKVGVRPSLEQAQEYYTVNVQGTQNMLELAREMGIRQFVFGSSSSVYGINSQVPWSEDNPDFRPISPYASTKLSGEMLGHVYSHLYDIRFVALRFFTVYGPRQRPDLAINKFVQLLFADQPIPVYGDGSTRRDYTFVEDIVSGIIAAMHYEKTKYEVFNLGNNQIVPMHELISLLELLTGHKAVIDHLPEQAGDVRQTFANINKARQHLNYQPTNDIKTGLRKYISWYKQQKKIE
jgi:UDP-glucuronate 4-epimerase